MQSERPPVLQISIHALLAESDFFVRHVFADGKKFLSTLSLRRATAGKRAQQTNNQISIHALLAESDPAAMLLTFLSFKFLSTLSLRRATHTPRSGGPWQAISIHALLAESDGPHQQHERHLQNFYPRSPCGERLMIVGFNRIKDLFLSTLSLRRATSQQPEDTTRTTYFYPRSPCGERQSLWPSD